MLMEKERQEIVDYGKKMSSAGLSKGTSGNISAYDPVCGYMAISPSGLDYFETAAEDIVILDLNGTLRKFCELVIGISFFKQVQREKRSVILFFKYNWSFCIVRTETAVLAV